METIHKVLFAAAVTVGASACSKETQERFDRAGEATESALESTAEDVQHGADAVVSEADRAEKRVQERVEAARHERTEPPRATR